MSDSQTKHPIPPYATFAPFINLSNKLRDSGVPGRIDPSVFGNASGSLSYSVIAALKSLGFIEQNGTPTESFKAFVTASDMERKPLLAEAMKNAYPSLHGGKFPISNATASQFDEHIRTHYDARGSTVDKVASFFIAACDYASITISDLIKARKPSASSNMSNRSKRQRRVESEKPSAVEVSMAEPISHAALEYKLVDLMREEDVNAEERNAIWVLLQYLTTTRKNKKAVDQ
jgi:hypothetical protein